MVMAPHNRPATNRRNRGDRSETTSFPIGLSRLALVWVLVGIFAIPVLLSALRVDPGRIVAVAMVWIFLPAAVWVGRRYREGRQAKATEQGDRTDPG